MRVDRLSLEGYRNLSRVEFHPSEQVNVIYGRNAQGKTNLLEAIWLFTGGRSFRGAKDAELVGFGREKTRLDLEFFAAGREQTALLTIEQGKRRLELNELPLRSPAGMVGNFCSVIFSPTHLSLIKDGPAERRKFLDAAICQRKPSYATALNRYNRSIVERNALLKNLYHKPYLQDTLDAWDEQICRLGSLLIQERKKYVDLLLPHVREIYGGISGNCEEMGIRYLSSFPLEEGCGTEEIYARMLEACRAQREEDIRAAHTSVGPHREDLDLTIDGISARHFGSQGQQRSCVLALKLSEAEILKESIGEQPVVLLDDVMSELDTQRQDYILNHMDGWQVFVTCCDPVAILRMVKGKAFEMEGGVLTER